MTTKRVLILGANSSVAEATDLRLCGAAGVFVAVQDLGAVPAGEVTGLFLGSVMQLGGLDQVLLAVFVHLRRFVGAARSQAGALAMARGALELSK